MKLKIVSDGTGDGTKILDENGERIENAVSVNWEIEASNNAIATITFMNVPVELVGESIGVVDNYFKVNSRFARFKRFIKKLW